MLSSIEVPKPGSPRPQRRARRLQFFRSTSAPTSGGGNQDTDDYSPQRSVSGAVDTRAQNLPKAAAAQANIPNHPLGAILLARTRRQESGTREEGIGGRLGPNPEKPGMHRRFKSGPVQSATR